MMKTYKLTKEDEELVKMAKALAKPKKVVGGIVREVGCALITKSGKIFTGASMDLACGIGFCGEHSAISNMIAHSNEIEIKTLAACSNSKTNPAGPPCGRCRELMNLIDKNNHKNTFVIISDKAKVKLGDLLPLNWLEGENWDIR
jgi:cytidine deaminase